jgi:hypothetical protein
VITDSIQPDVQFDAHRVAIGSDAEIPGFRAWRGVIVHFFTLKSGASRFIEGT